MPTNPYDSGTVDYSALPLRLQAIAHFEGNQNGNPFSDQAINSDSSATGWPQLVGKTYRNLVLSYPDLKTKYGDSIKDLPTTGDLLPAQRDAVRQYLLKNPQAQTDAATKLDAEIANGLAKSKKLTLDRYYYAWHNGLQDALTADDTTVRTDPNVRKFLAAYNGIKNGTTTVPKPTPAQPPPIELSDATKSAYADLKEQYPGKAASSYLDAAATKAIRPSDAEMGLLNQARSFVLKGANPDAIKKAIGVDPDTISAWHQAALKARSDVYAPESGPQNFKESYASLLSGLHQGLGQALEGSDSPLMPAVSGISDLVGLNPNPPTPDQSDAFSKHIMDVLTLGNAPISTAQSEAQLSPGQKAVGSYGPLLAAGPFLGAGSEALGGGVKGAAAVGGLLNQASNLNGKTPLQSIIDFISGGAMSAPFGMFEAHPSYDSTGVDIGKQGESVSAYRPEGVIPREPPPVPSTSDEPTINDFDIVSPMPLEDVGPAVQLRGKGWGINKEPGAPGTAEPPPAPAVAPAPDDRITSQKALQDLIYRLTSPDSTTPGLNPDVGPATDDLDVRTRKAIMAPLDQDMADTRAKFLAGQRVDVPTDNPTAVSPQRASAPASQPQQLAADGGTPEGPIGPTEPSAGPQEPFTSSVGPHSPLQSPYQTHPLWDMLRNSGFGKAFGRDDLSQAKELVQNSYLRQLDRLNSMLRSGNLDPKIAAQAKTELLQDHLATLRRVDPTVSDAEAKVWMDNINHTGTDIISRNLARQRGWKFVTSAKSMLSDFPVNAFANALTMTDPTRALLPEGTFGAVTQDEMDLARKFGALQHESLGNINQELEPGQTGLVGKVADKVINTLGHPSDTILARQRTAGFMSEYNRYLKLGYDNNTAGDLAAQRVNKFYPDYPVRPNTALSLGVDRVLGMKPGTSQNMFKNPLVRGFVNSSTSWPLNIAKAVTSAATDSPRTALTLSAFLGAGAATTHGAFSGVSLKDREAALAKLPPMDRWRAKVAGVPYHDANGDVKFRDASEYAGILDYISGHRFDPSADLFDKTAQFAKETGQAFLQHGSFSDLLSDREPQPYRPGFMDSLQNLEDGGITKNNLYDVLSSPAGRLVAPSDLLSVLAAGRDQAFDRPGDNTLSRGVANYFAPQIGNHADVRDPLQIQSEMNKDASTISQIYDPNKGGLNESRDNQDRLRDKYLERIRRRARQESGNDN